MRTKLVIPLMLALATTLSTIALAENSTSVPGHTIHHNAFTTDTLTPAITKLYRIQRSKNRGMLNVSVVKDAEGTLGKSVSADVKATATNLSGQLKEIEMREIKDGNAVYYIGDFRVTDQETLIFVIEVKPQGDSETFTATLTQQFFTN